MKKALAFILGSETDLYKIRRINTFVKSMKYRPIRLFVPIGLCLILVFLLLPMLVACSFTSNKDLWPSAHAIHSFESNSDSSLKLLWTKNVFTGYVVTNRELGAANDKVIFIGSLNQKDPGGLIVLDSKNGDLLWKIPDAHTLGVTPEILYVGYHSSVSAYNLTTGEKIWKITLPAARNVGYVQVLNDLLYINTTGGYFYYLVDATTGEIVDRSQQADVFNLSPMLIQAFLNYPTITDKAIYFRALQSSAFSAIVAADTESGHILWKTENNVISNVAATKTRVFYLTFDDEMRILNAHSGELVEAIALKPSINFFDKEINPQSDGFQVSVDEINQLLFVLLGDSNQLFAFRIISQVK